MGALGTGCSCSSKRGSHASLPGRYGRMPVPFPGRAGIFQSYLRRQYSSTEHTAERSRHGSLARAGDACSLNVFIHICRDEPTIGHNSGLPSTTYNTKYMCSCDCTGGAWVGDTSDASCHSSRNLNLSLPLACYQTWYFRVLKDSCLVTGHKH